MPRGYWIAAALVAAVLVWKRNTIASLTVNTSDALNNANVRAFLAMVKQFESNGDYSVLYGGGHFSDFSDHPNVRVPFYNPKKPGLVGMPNDYSTAAGAYQINHPTWLLVYPLIDGTDFSPASQDEAAVALLKDNGALSLIIAGDFQGAIDAASGTWASLPSSTSGQRKVSMQVAQSAYQNNGGTFA